MALLIFGILFLTGSAAQHLLLQSPVKVPEQCECRKGMLSTLTPAPGQMPTEITITGLFSFDTYNFTCGVHKSNISSYMLPAALIALDEINNSSEILSGYHLKLDVRDSRCDPIHAITELSDSLSGGLNRFIQPQDFNLGILGPNCPEVTKAVAGVVSRSVRLPVISYGFNSPALKEGEDSTLFNTVRSLLQTMQSAIGVLEYFGWTKNIAFMSENSDDIFLTTVENVIKIVDVQNSKILTDGVSRIPVTVFEVIAGNDNRLVQMFIDKVRQNNIRVIVGLLSQKNAAQVICTAKNGTIPGDGFVYVFVGTYSKNWWKIETDHCLLTSDDVQSAIILSGMTVDPDFVGILETDNTLNDFVDEFSLRLKRWCNEPPTEIITIAASVYDSVWSMALALNESRDEIELAVSHGLHYDPDTLSAIVRSLSSTNFNGLTGRVGFSNGKRDGADAIQQIQNGSEVLVGWYIDDKVVLTQDLVWNGNGNVSLSDTPTVIYTNVAPYFLIIVSVFVFAGMVFGLFLWIFNAYHSRHRILLATSQKLNYIIILGLFFGLFSVVILTFLDSPLGLIMSNDLFKALCIIRIWMLPLSFTFSFGVLFVRAWRIYRVFNNPWKRKRPYKDYHLMLFVIGVAAGDVLILLPWTVIDPYRRFNITSGIDYESYSESISFSCSSTSSLIWLAILSTYKIAIILAGIVIIILVRKEVKERKIFDDTRSLAGAAYLSAGAFIIGLSLTLLFLISDRVTLSYLVSATWVNIATTGTLMVIFLPKIYRITIKKDSGTQYRRARRLYYGEGTVYTGHSKTMTTKVNVTVDRLSPRDQSSPSNYSASPQNLDASLTLSDSNLSDSNYNSVLQSKYVNFVANDGTTL